MTSEKKASATISSLVTKASGGDDTQEFFINDKQPANNAAQGLSASSGVLIKDKLRKKNMLVPGSVLGQGFIDEYRRIKRPLMSNAYGKSASLVERGNLILVTSSIPGEGKTHTSINLALSIAQERDNTVLLIDCDTTRQGTSKTLGISNKPGLVELLINEHYTVGDVILHTDIPELNVISSGVQSEYITELLTSNRMSDLMAELAARYDDRIIIFDSPPMLATTQTPVLANLVGQVVFVIESGKTPQSIVEEALELIPRDKAIGIVMNKSEGLINRGGYYYYGYYASESGEQE